MLCHECRARAATGSCNAIECQGGEMPFTPEAVAAPNARPVGGDKVVACWPQQPWCCPGLQALREARALKVLTGRPQGDHCTHLPSESQAFKELLHLTSPANGQGSPKGYG